MAQFQIGELIKSISEGLKAYRVKLYGTDGANEVEVKTSATGELKVDANLQVSGSDNSLNNPAFIEVTGSKTGNKVSASFTRPNLTDAYAAGDVISNSTSAPTVLTFANVGQAGDEIMILGLRALFKKAATALSIPAGMTTFKLHLYHTAPTAINDNAAWTLPYADADKYICPIQTANVKDKGDVLRIEDTDNLNIAVNLVGTDLYAIIETDGAYTPTAEVVKVWDLHYMAI